MLEVAAAILVAVVVMIFVGEFVALAAIFFGLFLVGVSGILIYVLHLSPTEVGLGIVAGSIVIATIAREANHDARQIPRSRPKIRD